MADTPTPATTTTRQTADAAYTERATDCQRHLDSLARLLAQHAVEQAESPTRWDHVGDLGHVEELLRQARNFLAGIDD